MALTRCGLLMGRSTRNPLGRGGNFLVTPTLQSNVRGRVDVKARELLDLDDALRGYEGHQGRYSGRLPDAIPGVSHARGSRTRWSCARPITVPGDVWAKAGNKIRYVVIPPLRDIDASISELRYGKEHGACGVFFRGIEGDRTLDDPYFFPVYEEAQVSGAPDLHPPGPGCAALTTSLTFAAATPSLTVGFPQSWHSVTWLQTRSRSCFLDSAGALLRQAHPGFLRHVSAAWNSSRAGRFWGPGLFDKYNMWISYEVEEDLPYLLKYIGEDDIVVGTDYGHHTPGTTDRLSADSFGPGPPGYSDADARGHLIDDRGSHLEDNPWRFTGCSRATSLETEAARRFCGWQTCWPLSCAHNTVEDGHRLTIWACWGIRIHTRES